MPSTEILTISARMEGPPVATSPPATYPMKGAAATSTSAMADDQIKKFVAHHNFLSVVIVRLYVRPVRPVKAIRLPNKNNTAPCPAAPVSGLAYAFPH
jgi:hypothetical protein